MAVGAVNTGNGLQHSLIADHAHIELLPQSFQHFLRGVIRFSLTNCLQIPLGLIHVAIGIDQPFQVCGDGNIPIRGRRGYAYRVRPHLAISEQIPKSAVFVAAADNLPNGQTPLLCIPGADGCGEVSGNHADVHLVSHSRLPELPKYPKPQGDPNGNSCPVAAGPIFFGHELCQATFQVTVVSLRIVPGFRQKRPAPQAFQLHRPAAHGKLHVHSSQLYREEKIEDLPNSLVKGLPQKGVQRFHRNERHPKGQKESAVPTAAFMQGSVASISVTILSCGYIQHVPSLQWHCSR